MTDNEKDIVAINRAARVKETSYGKFVSRASKDEIKLAVREHWPREKKRKRT